MSSYSAHKPDEVSPAGIKKFITYACGSILGYIVFASLVINFYKDDPEYMDLVDRQEFTLKYINKLNEQRISNASEVTSKTTQDVIDYLGSPDITEAKESQGIVYQIMFYRTHQVNSDDITTKDECTGFLFINDHLIGWGPKAYKHYKKYWGTYG